MTPRSWYTSDLHFGHEKIIGYSGRPFSDARHMDREMVRRWNAVVGPQDVVHVLGDFAMSRHEPYLNSLNGMKILVRGNHDHGNLAKISAGWNHVCEYYEKMEGTVPVVMLHYPIESWNRMRFGAVHLHGHCHGSLRRKLRNRCDVGVECWDYAPVSFEEIVKRCSQYPAEDVDHHAEGHGAMAQETVRGVGADVVRAGEARGVENCDVGVGGNFGGDGS